eukprot:13354639-Alexandrium_andersonii.AAC.1
MSGGTGASAPPLGAQSRAFVRVATPCSASTCASAHASGHTFRSVPAVCVSAPRANGRARASPVQLSASVSRVP